MDGLIDAVRVEIAKAVDLLDASRTAIGFCAAAGPLAMLTLSLLGVAIIAIVHPDPVIA